ncbi:hypothetical protein P389DRAFT_211371 [Cystobasidium minutum MCA 4210]|uniref:uncharacterized protein n=1 Tax=Cystobasidium minutum MCA 4210 TaxID=1397322 RepID=UPI0034CF8DB9|eukprot:jgi/Rhomi1/211371/estExt_Genemark1.C_4_t30045
MRSPSTSNSSNTRYSRTMQATWLGETTALVQFISDSSAGLRNSEKPIQSLRRPTDTINVLFNPSTRATSSTKSSLSSSLLTCGGLFRGKGKLAASLTGNTERKVEDLPEIHYVVISNSSATELDAATVLGLHKRDNSRFIVAKGGASSLVKIGVPAHHITEVGAWEDESFQHDTSRAIRVTSIPATTPVEHPHTSKSKSAAPISHWVVQHETLASEKEEGSKTTVLFAASSPRPKRDASLNQSTRSVWQDIQARCAALDLAFIPVWAGKQTSPSLLQRIFSSKNSARVNQEYLPTKAAEIHQTIKSGLSIAMLHGLEPRSINPFSDDNDDEDDPSGPSSSIRTPEAVLAIAQLKAACDRTERRSVEFRRGQGSIKRKRNASQNRGGRGKSTFAVLNEGQSVSV